MKIVIHRGSNEIGGSCVELIAKSSRIIIDIGTPLVSNSGERFNFDEYKRLSGSALVKKKILPDIAGFYKWDDRKPFIDALFISHAHLDHYGFVNYKKDNLPVYLGKATQELIEITDVFTNHDVSVSNPKYIKDFSTETVGDFKVTPYLADHSAFDAYSFLIESGNKKVIYSGDFRNHGRNKEAFKSFLKRVPRNVDAMLLEGTMFGRVKCAVETERDIEIKIKNISEETKGITMFCSSSQNIDRLITFYQASKNSGRLMVIDFYTAHVLSEMKKYDDIPFPSNKFPEIRVFYPYWLSEMTVKKGYRKILYKFKHYKITRQEIIDNKEKVMILVRPSMLSDIRKLGDIKGGSLIYSLWKGYMNDPKTRQMLDYLVDRGLDIHEVHASGHADIDTLKHVVSALKPKKIIPIHTFQPEDFKIFGSSVRYVYDGETVEV